MSVPTRTGSFKTIAVWFGLGAGSSRPHFQELIRSWSFWTVQMLILLATLSHWSMEYSAEHGWFEASNIYVVATYTFFFIPIVVASFKFGLAGAIPTALWLAALAIPNIFIWHRGLDRVAEAVEFLTIIAFAIVVASRVDREIGERTEARRQSEQRRISEAKYRNLFDAAGEAILVFDRGGRVREANAAAGMLFQAPPLDICDQHLDSLIGSGMAEQVIEAATCGDNGSSQLILTQPDGNRTWLDPVYSRIFSKGCPDVYQVMLRDVTDERRRQNGLEAYARWIIQAQEEERRRIARDLHDSTLQSVILLYRQLDQMEMTVDDLTDDLRCRLHTARDQAEAIADELRRYSRDLRPSILDDLGLVAALRWLVTDLEKRHDIDTRLISRGYQERLSPDAELGLFRVVQEALRNVERHSHASSVEIRLESEPDYLSIAVEDNGRGFITDASSPEEPAITALGLLGMQERTRLLGGELKIVSTVGAGTCVRACLPRHQPASSRS